MFGRYMIEDCFYLRKLLDRRWTSLSRAISGILHPTEWQLFFSFNRWRTGINYIRFKSICRPASGADISCINRGGETIFNIIHNHNRLLISLDLEKLNHPRLQGEGFQPSLKETLNMRSCSELVTYSFIKGAGSLVLAIVQFYALSLCK